MPKLGLQNMEISPYTYSMVTIPNFIQKIITALCAFFLKHFNELMFMLVGTNNYASISQCCIHTSTFSLKYNSKKQRHQWTNC